MRYSEVPVRTIFRETTGPFKGDVWVKISRRSSVEYRSSTFYAFPGETDVEVLVEDYRGEHVDLPSILNSKGLIDG